MKPADLIAVLQKAIDMGIEEILFDTEAGTFDYHMATVDAAYVEMEPHPHVSLHTHGFIRHEPRR